MFLISAADKNSGNLLHLISVFFFKVFRKLSAYKRFLLEVNLCIEPFKSMGVEIAITAFILSEMSSFFTSVFQTQNFHQD